MKGTSFAVGVVAAFVCAILGGLASCNQPDSSNVSTDSSVAAPSIYLTAVSGSQTVPAGTVWTVVACAVQGEVDAGAFPCAQTDSGVGSASASPVDGLTLNFATTTTGVAFAPATNVTNGSGVASSDVVVPFGTQVAAVVSGGGAEQVIVLPPSGAVQPDTAITLTVSSLAPTGVLVPNGEVYECTIQAGSNGAADADTGTAVEGLAVSFSTTTMGVAFSPATVVTNGAGMAASSVVVPYGTEVQAIASGGGVVASTVAVAAPVTLRPGPLVATGTQFPAGELYSLSVMATVPVPGSPPEGGAPGDAGSPDAGPSDGGFPTPVKGLSISFATTTTGVTFSPTTVPTGAGGVATSYVVIPYGTQIQAVVAGGGAVVLPVLPGGGSPIATVTLTATDFASTGVALPTGESFALSVMATSTGSSGDAGPDASVASPIAGLGLSFATTTTGVTFSPSTVVTNEAGVATSNVVIPYGTEVQAIVSGGGAVTAPTTSAPAVTLAPSGFAPTGTVVPAGVVYTLGVTAMTGAGSDGGAPSTSIPGLSVSFATTTMGINFSPSNIATNDAGTATANVVVPFGTWVQAVVAGGGSATMAPVTAPAVMLTPGALIATGTLLPAGELYTLNVNATVPIQGDASLPVEGLNVAFSTVTAGVAFSPASVPTNDAGMATSSVVIPYGTGIQAVVAAGGSVANAPASDASTSAPGLTVTAALAQPDSGAACSAPGACVLTASAAVGGVALQGVGVTLSFTDFMTGDASTSGSSTISGPSSAILTNAAGTASYAFVIPPNVAGFVAVASAGGAAGSAHFP